MAITADRNLETIKAELQFIARSIQDFESDFERVDTIAHPVDRALKATFDHTATAVAEISAGVVIAKAA